MRRSLLIVLLAAAPGPALRAQDTAHVVVVATTDLHGHATAWDYVHDRPAPWGLVRAATVVDSLRAAYPGAVVLVDAGDLIQGNPFATYFATVRPRLVNPTIDAMNAMRFDAATPGNHEFDFGLDVLTRAYGGAAFPFVAANVFRLPRDTVAFPPHVVVSRGGVRVGITGFTTPGVMVWNGDRLRGRLLVRRIPDLAAAAVRATREAGADVVVALVHSGFGGGSSYDTTGAGAENEAHRLAALPERPDLVIVGHTHRRLRDSVVNGVHFVQPQPWARSVSIVHAWLVPSAAGRARLVRVAADEVVLADVPPEPGLVRRLADAHAEVRTWVDRPLATVEGDWGGREVRARDTPLMDFLNDVQRRRAGAQLSAAAAFAAPARFGPGPVRLRDVAGLYPYENTLKAVRIDGARLRAFLEWSARYFRAYEPGRPPIADTIPGYNYDMVSGVEYEIDLLRPVGERIRRLSYRGRLVTPADTFTLALNSYRQAGGGGYAMLAGLPVVYDRGENIRDLLVAELEAADILRAPADFQESWWLAPAQARAAVRALYVPPEVARDTVLVRLLATNDLHGALETATAPWGDGRPVGGAAVLKAWMDSLARTCDCPTVRLDGGDALQGTPISNFVLGRSTVEAMNAIGYDAVAIGNHEFDWTVDTLRARIGESTFPWLAANLVDSATGTRPAWAGDWRVFERQGRRIAVVGVASPSTPTTTNPLRVAGYQFLDPGSVVRGLLPAIRAAAPDVIVVLGHVGAHCDTTCRGEAIDLVTALGGETVDIVLGGHTGSDLITRVRGIPLALADHNGFQVTVADVVRRANGEREVRVRHDTLWADVIRPDSQVARIVTGYGAAVAERAGRRVATLKFTLPQERPEGRESSLGLLIADAFRTAGRTDAALINDGGIRADLPGGPVTYGALYRVLPFANRLLRVTVTGEVLLRVVEHALAGARPTAHLSGVAIRYDPRRPAGSRMREARFQDGRPIERRGTYTLTVPDFLAVGGGGYTMLPAARAEDLGVTDLEAVQAYLARLPQPVEAPSAARVVPTR